MPAGSFVTGSFQVGSFGGPAGIYVVDRATGAVAPVTGLPGEITGAAYPGSIVVGCGLVVRRPLDGALVATAFASGVTNVQAPLFLMTLSGNTVVSTVRYDLGLPSATGLLASQAHVLADGRIVLAVDGLGVVGQPLFGAILGIVDPSQPNGSPGAVQAVPVAPLPPGAPNGLAVDEAAGVAYLGMIQNGLPSEIWSVPLGGGAAHLVATVPETITNMAFATNGQVIAVCSGSGGIYRVDVGPGIATRFTTVNNLNGVAVDRATGDLILATGAPGPVLRRVDPLGAITTIANAPAGGWGTLVGVDLHQDPEPYGNATPAGSTYVWQTDNGGGAPVVGNAAFRLVLQAAPTAPQLSAIVAAFAPAPAPLSVLGMAIELDPAALLVQFVGPGAAAFVQPVPLPAAPGLAGARFYFQSFHLEANALLGSSRGLALEILH